MSRHPCALALFAALSLAAVGVFAMDAPVSAQVGCVVIPFCSTTTTVDTTTTLAATTTTAATTTIASTTTSAISTTAATTTATTTSATAATTTATTIAPTPVSIPSANDSAAATTVAGSGTTTTSSTRVASATTTTSTTSISASTTTTFATVQRPAPSGRFLRVVVQTKGAKPGPAAGFGVVLGCNGKDNVDAAIAYPPGAGEQNIEVKTETDRCGVVVNPKWRAGELASGFWTATLVGPPFGKPVDVVPINALPKRDRTGSFGFAFAQSIVISYWPGEVPLSVRIRARGGTQAPFPSVNVQCPGATPTVGPGAGGQLVNQTIVTPWDKVVDVGPLAFELGCRPGSQLQLNASPPPASASAPLKVAFATRAKATGLVSGALVTLGGSQQLDVLWKP